MTDAAIPIVDASEEAVTQALAGLRAAFASGRSRPLEWRLAQLAAIEHIIRTEQDAMVDAATEDLGRPSFETVNMEVAPMLGDIVALQRELPDFLRPSGLPTPLALQPARSTLLPQPKGVVLLFGAWNFPFQLVLQPLAAMLAAGNCVLVKPSEKSPVSARLVQRLVESYLDRECVRFVQGGGATGARLLREKYDHILYTGGEQVGRLVYQAAAAQLTPCTLELGGSNFAYVHQDADVALAARRLLQGAMANAGQVCVGLSVALVHRDLLPRLAPRLQQTLLDFYGAEPKQSSSLGRLVDKASAARVKELLGSHGGETLCGGQVDVEDRYVAPTLVLEPARDSRLFLEESFAPVLSLVAVDSVQEAVEIQRPRPTALAKYVFARDKEVVEYYLQAVPAGMACVNDVMMQGANRQVPFGGLGDSGTGAYHGLRGVVEFSHMLGTVYQPAAAILDAPFRYPPYTPRAQKLLAAILSFEPKAWLQMLLRGVKPSARIALQVPNGTVVPAERYVCVAEYRLRDSKGAEFEKRWAERKSTLGTSEGFRYFALLRRIVSADGGHEKDVDYVAVTIWARREDCERYQRSAEVGRGHLGMLKLRPSAETEWEGIMPVWPGESMTGDGSHGVDEKGESLSAPSGQVDGRLPADSFVVMSRLRANPGYEAYLEQMAKAEGEARLRFTREAPQTAAKAMEARRFLGYLMLRRQEGIRFTYSSLSVWKTEADYKAFLGARRPRDPNVEAADKAAEKSFYEALLTLDATAGHALPSSVREGCSSERRRLREGEAAWWEEWGSRIDCWWIGLPGPTQAELGACLSALSLHLGSRLQRLRGMPAPAGGAAEAGCEWLEGASEQLALPDFPSLDGFDVSLPPIPRLLPSWKGVQSRVPATQPTSDTRLLTRSSASSSIAAAGAGAGAAALATVAFALVRGAWQRRRNGSNGGGRVQLRKREKQ